MTIQPNRDNWREFCEEPPITEEERALWHSIVATVLPNEELMDDLCRSTEDLWQEYHDIQATDDWSDLVAGADALRRLERAEIAWWKQRRHDG